MLKVVVSRLQVARSCWWAGCGDRKIYGFATARWLAIVNPSVAFLPLRIPSCRLTLSTLTPVEVLRNGSKLALQMIFARDAFTGWIGAKRRSRYRRLMEAAYGMRGDGHGLR